ncbi:hypothetical protein PIB30_087937 [Stylosanthes scabra]|uniref:Glutamic acid-rich protein-like n=1 Tax=Stylosanthes scabra TaxID=79078 RepID=A0ABU6VWQ8_9FABA|nr:hypothetical protein [Stylosanthes scabra]
MIKPNHFKEKRKKGKPKDNTGSDQKKKRKKRGRSSMEEKKEKGLAEAESKKTTIKCSRFIGLMKKVKALKNVLSRNKNMDAHLMAPKGKGKIYGPPTRASPRLATLRAQAATNLACETPDTPAVTAISTLGRKPRMRVKYLTKQLAARDAPPSIGSTSRNPIAISSDSEKEDPEMDSAEESEEVPEYIPKNGPTENQNPGEEEPEGSVADHEMDPNLDSEEEQDPEEEEEEDPEEEEEEEENPEEEEKPDEEHEMEEEQEEAERDPNDNDEFQDYFALAPPASPDSNDASILPADD